MALAAGAEMLELRTDYLENLNPALVPNLVCEVRDSADAVVPVIVTCRDPQQGGARPYPQQLRIDVLAEAVRAGAEFIDFEYENYRHPQAREKIRAALAQSTNSRLILSAHNFERKFRDIEKTYCDILAVAPTAIPKLVYTANHINDCFEASDLLRQSSGGCIVLCMGEAGLISRVLAKKLDSFVTFASIDEQSGTALGQLTVKELRELYRYDRIDADTQLFGVIADPVGHSLSPAIHNACFAEQNMNRLYLPLLVHGGQSEFDTFLDNVLSRHWLGFRGFSVTIPHKHHALAYVRAKQGFVEPLAEKIGAVNTVVVGPDGELSAYNTDYAAALDAITSALKIDRAALQDLPVAVVGAGGVARAIVAGLSDAGANIKIYNRTVERAEKLAGEFNCAFAGLDELPSLDAKLLINCTSIGMHPNVGAPPVPKQYLRKDMAVFDTVYNPVQTLLLRQAREVGAKTIDGLSMFVNQAAAQFKLFTGRRANAQLMRKTITDCLRKR
jgi:3-dehydroquinate dehydratase/shikimate dehydrogenase